MARAQRSAGWLVALLVLPVVLVVVMLAVVLVPVIMGEDDPPPSVEVVDVVAMPATPGSLAAVYVSLRNGGGSDRLLAARLVTDGEPGRTAAPLTIHRSYTDEQGRTLMGEVESLEIAAGADVRMEPGATHLMAGPLTGPWVLGGTVELELELERSGTVGVDVEIVDPTELGSRPAPA